MLIEFLVFDFEFCVDARSFVAQGFSFAFPK